MFLNVADEWLTHLLPIREDSDSNFGPKPGYTVRVFIAFLSLSRQMQGQCVKLDHDRFLARPF
jgi:hypothetical protein